MILPSDISYDWDLELAIVQQEFQIPNMEVLYIPYKAILGLGGSLT